MSNTKTLQTIARDGNRATIYLTLASDGTNETNYVVYDSSAVATTLKITDPLTCTLESVYASASTANTARLWLSWDATTPVVALDIPPATNPTQVDFRRDIPIGGLKNQGGTGITGDVTLTTTGLASGDKITIVLEVRAN